MSPPPGANKHPGFGPGGGIFFVHFPDHAAEGPCRRFILDGPGHIDAAWQSFRDNDLNALLRYR